MLDRILRLLYSSFIKMDFYGHKIDLYIGSERYLKSEIGALFSVVILFISVYAMSQNIADLISLQKLTTISSSKTLSVTEVLAKNQSIEFDFDFSNYYIYFSLTANFPNGSRLYAENLTRFFTQNYSFLNKYGVEVPLPFEKCFTRSSNKFLMINADLGNKINETSKATYCLKENTTVQMGFFPDVVGKHVYHTEISYSVKRCENTTANGNKCAPDKEIEAILPYIQVQSSAPRTLFDFNNPQNPRLRTYDYDIYHLDMSISKMSYARLQPVFLNTDRGLIYDSYKLDSVDFNTERVFYENSLRKSTDAFFKYSVTFGPNQVIYNRLNEKIYMIFASFGGFFNVLFLLGKILCTAYNFLLLKHKLINFSFSNADLKSQTPSSP